MRWGQHLQCHRLNEWYRYVTPSRFIVFVLESKTPNQQSQTGFHQATVSCVLINVYGITTSSQIHYQTYHLSEHPSARVYWLPSVSKRAPLFCFYNTIHNIEQIKVIAGSSHLYPNKKLVAIIHFVNYNTKHDSYSLLGKHNQCNLQSKSKNYFFFFYSIISSKSSLYTYIV